jgi:hypothetical protein
MYDIFQFDLKFDVLPPNDPAVEGSTAPDPRLNGRTFLFGGSGTQGVNFYKITADNPGDTEPQLPLDNDFHTYTIQRTFDGFGSGAWDGTFTNVRIDVSNGLPQDASGYAAQAGAVFSIDNVKLGRTTSTEAFPVITPSITNFIKNGDVSSVSNLVLSGDNDGAADINGGHGNFGPFRGSSVDVDFFTPYNNNPNSIVEAIADGGSLDLEQVDNEGVPTGVLGSYYIDTHWATGAERFSLNSAGGYLNGLVQENILDGVTIDESATYEFSFDATFNNRTSNVNSTLTVGLTVGTGSAATDPNNAVAGVLLDNQLSNLTSGDKQVLTISGVALKAAQTSGQVNLILQSLNTTAIPNFPPAGGADGDYNSDGIVDAADYTVWRDGDSPDDTQAGYELWRANYGSTGAGPVPNDHVQNQVVSQVQLDNFSLNKVFVELTGDVNKDGVVSQADLDLAQLYFDGNGGETATKRQDDLFNLPAAYSDAQILASLNLVDFDLDGNSIFQQADLNILAGLVSAPTAGADAAPEPTALVLLGLALAAAPTTRRRRS